MTPNAPTVSARHYERLLRAAMRLGELMEAKNSLELKRHNAKTWRRGEWSDADKDAWAKLAQPYNEAKGALLRAYRDVLDGPNEMPSSARPAIKLQGEPIETDAQKGHERGGGG